MTGALSLLCSSLIVASSIPLITPDIEVPVIPGSYSYENKFDYIKVDPVKDLEPTMNMVIKVSFQNALVEPAIIKIKTFNDNYRDGVLLTTLYTSSKEATLNFDYLPTYSRVRYAMNIFQFELESEFGTDKVFIDAANSDYDNQHLYPTGSTFSYTSPKNIGIYRRGSGISYEDETFTFSRCYDSIYLSSFSPLSLSTFRMEYKGPIGTQFRCSSPRLLLETPANTMNDFGDQMLGKKVHVINLKANLSEFGNYIYFSFAHDTYVDPTTLEMSSKYKEGYLKTDKIYFPASMEENTKFKLEFVIAYSGANPYSFIYRTEVTLSKRAFGNCFDSTYCVTTSESEPDIDLGDKIIK